MSDAARGGWPAHEWENREWHTDPTARDRSGLRPPIEDRMLTSIEAAIPPMVSELPIVLSGSTTAVVEEATASVAALDAGPGVSLGAMGEFLTRSEAVASSKVERVHADRRDFALALAGKDAGLDALRTTAALRSLHAMVAAASRHRIDLDQILEAHRALFAGDPEEGSWAGRVRSMQNWLGPNDFTPRDAAYVPPAPERLGHLLADLVVAANRTDVGVIANAAVVHAQFESIHPFTDGNGRVGRALISAVMRRRGLTSNTVVPTAAVMLADTDAYFMALERYREGDVEAMVTYVARATVVACGESKRSADALAELPGRWRDAVAPRAGSATSTLVDSLLDDPILDIGRVIEITGVSTRRAYDAIDRLEGAEVLDEITGNVRDRVWVVPDVLDELDRFEARIGHRVAPQSTHRRG